MQAAFFPDKDIEVLLVLSAIVSFCRAPLQQTRCELLIGFSPGCHAALAQLQQDSS